MSIHTDSSRGMTPWRAQMPNFMRRAPVPAEALPFPEKDPTCPECEGRCTDAHGFDCRRCGGDGVVDE